MMKRLLSIFAVVLLLTMQLMPMEVMAEEGSYETVNSTFSETLGGWGMDTANGEVFDAPERPYEQVIAKNGSWYTEPVKTGAGQELTVGYEGSYAVDGETLANFNPIMFSVSRDMVLTGIYLPYVNISGGLSVTMTDGEGNVYGPFQPNALPAVAVSTLGPIAGSEEAGLTGRVMYSFDPTGTIVLPKGDYTVTLSDPASQVRTKQTGVQGAYLFTGMYAKAYLDYRNDLTALPGEKAKDPETIGEDFTEDPLGSEAPPLNAKPATFSLEADTMVDEVLINTINGGMGVMPGTIAILDETTMEVLYMEQAYGVTLADVVNGMWAIAPEVVFPAGNYVIGLSDPGAITYDDQGEPLFYINVSDPPVYRYDFTGTYNLDLGTYKRFTLMGPVNDTTPSFSLKDFELTILDHGEWLELIGIYEDMPFSLEAPIIGIVGGSVIAQADFMADLSKLPAKTKIGAQAQLILTKDGDDPATVSIQGEATYDRAATSDKGADSNKYEVNGEAYMVKEALAPYVVAALGAAMAAGNVPGPDSPLQTSVGLLFPPLAGLVVHVVSEAFKKTQAAKKPKLKKYSKEWYRQEYPGASDEDLAWIMLADAMGSTDEPDEGDMESISDAVTDNNEGNGDYEGVDEDNGEQDQEEPEREPVYEEPKPELTEEDFMSEEEKAERAAAKAEEPVEPEVPEQKPWDDWPDTKTLPTGIDGKTSTYELDRETGEYVNPLTDGVLDEYVYEKVVKPNLEKDQAFVDEQRRKIAAGDTAQDRALEKMLAEEKQDAAELKQQEYKERIMKKYGATTEDELKSNIKEMQKRETESAANWNMIGNIARAGEIGAVVTGAVCDTAVDFMGDRLGVAGRVIRAGYKVTKGVAGDMAESGVSWKSAESGFVKGGFDALTDFTGNKWAKGALTVSGETLGGFVGADDGKQMEGAASGFVGGVVKVGTGWVTDKAVGKFAGGGWGDDISLGTPSKGFTQVVTTQGKRLITSTMTTKQARELAAQKIGNATKESAIKVATATADYFGVKPVFTDPVAKGAAGLFADAPTPKKTN